ncbi:MAG: ribosome silencing factor [bacterium]|nr:ribosome silencing factor [bacterium]
MSSIIETIVKTLSGLKLTDIIVYDFRTYSPLFDYVVIATGSSERQVGASVHHMRDALGPMVERIRIEGAEESRWILFDLGDVLVNVMHKEEREYYGLEKLFIERPRLTLDV